MRYKIDINEIFNPTEEEIRDLYSRVNKYTVQLNKQELRKADFPGDFIRLSEKLAELPYLNEGIKDKKEYLNDVCENYMVLENKDEYEKKFNLVIEDISKLFDGSVILLRKSRFKQKSDFYSLFAAVYQLQNNGKITDDETLMNQARTRLKKMDNEISPQSQDKNYLEYATRCLSDANSRANREWRTDFIKERIKMAYVEGLN